MLSMLGSPSLMAQTKLTEKPQSNRLTAASRVEQQSKPFGFDAFIQRLNKMGAKPRLHMRAVSPARVDGDVTTIKYTTWFGTEKNTWTSIFKFDTKNEKVTIDGFLDGMTGMPSNEIVAGYEDNSIFIPCGGQVPTDTTGTVITSFDDGSGNNIECFLFSGTADASGNMTSYDKTLALNVSENYDSISSNGRIVGLICDMDGWTEIGRFDNGMVLTRIVESPVVTDFSSIVTTGNADLLTWDNSSLFPWTLDNGVAITGNKGATYKSSTLKATVTTTTDMRLTFDIRLYADTRDSLNFYVDKYRMFQYSSPDKVRTETYSCIIPAGKHLLNWDYVKMMYNADDDVAKISNLKLEPVDNFTAVSPDKSVSDFTIDGVANYNGSIRTTDKAGTFTIKKNFTANGGISFDVNADKTGAVKVTVDGTEELNASADTTFYHNFTSTGEHTVVCTFDNQRDTTTAAVSNVYYTEGACKEIHRAYMINGQSYFDANGSYTAENGQYPSYPVDVYLTSTHKAIFKNLIQNSTLTTQFPVVGTYNNGKIIIPTTVDFNHAILYGYDSNTLADMDKVYYNNRYWLESGSVTSSELRYTKAGYRDSLVFDVSADEKTLTAETGFGLWASWSWGFNEGTLEFMKAGTQLISTVDGTSLIGQTAGLDFSTYANTGKVTKTVNVINNGNAATDYEVLINNDTHSAFSVTPHTGNIKPQQSVALSITYEPKTAAADNATLSVTSEADKDVTVALKGTATGAPDYSQIVTEGKELITWTTSAAYPWNVNGGVASNSNKGYFKTTSSLTGAFTVPEGYYARISGDIAADMEVSSDLFTASCDGNVFENFNSRFDDADFGYIVKSGNHTVTFATTMDGVDEFPCSDIAQLSNVKLTLFKEGSDAAVVLKPNYKFDDPVAYDLGDSIYVRVINKGTNVLKFNSTEATAPFKVKAIADVAAGDTALIPVFMQPCDTGSYKGNITFHTSAGDLPLTVQAKSDYIRYIGAYEAYDTFAPVCTFYTMYTDYPIYTQSIYPAKRFKGLEGAKITEMTFFTTGVPQVILGAKDVQWQVMATSADSIATTSPKPEGFTTVYSGGQLPINDYELTIPFDEPFAYNGGNFLYSHLMNSYESFTYSFPFRFEAENAVNMPSTTIWESTWGWQSGATAPQMRIRYIPTTSTAISNSVTSSSDKVVGVKYYNAAGVELNKLERGLNIVVKKYADGTVKSTKQIVR